MVSDEALVPGAAVGDFRGEGTCFIWFYLVLFGYLVFFSHCLLIRTFCFSGLLKKPGLSVDVRDKFGNTPLIVACQNGHGRLAKMCVRYGADVNAVNHKKNTPLHFTVQYGFNALGDFLVDKGANRDARNDEGKTPYEGL